MRRGALPLVVLASVLAGSACQSQLSIFEPIESPLLFAPARARDSVDILFVIDDSPSMASKQLALQKRIERFLDPLLTGPRAYSLHIGVVTSDLGANSFTDSTGSCVRGGSATGGGRLQRIGAAADASCQAIEGPFAFINYDATQPLADGTARNNLPPGQDLETTLRCMSAVGENGCGFEQSLEAAYRALRDTSIEDNTGFLRADALLAVVWLTDEDDCSAPPSSDVFDPMPSTPPEEGGGGLGLLSSFRCTKFSIACGSPPALVPYAASGGPLLGCHDADPAENKLYPVSRYISFFTKPASQGGVKLDPRDVMLFAIRGPEQPFETILGNPITQSVCLGPLGQNCQVLLRHSCIDPTTPSLFGDPAVRLTQVVEAAKTYRTASICADDYAVPIFDFASDIVRRLGGGCVELPFADPRNPQCEVNDVTTLSNGTVATFAIARCDQNGNQKPCWQAATDPACTSVCARPGETGQRFTITVDRDTPLLPNTTTEIACHVIEPTIGPDGDLPQCAL